jgi:hypothetical protein
MAGLKCRRRPTLVEKGFEPPTLLQRIAVSQSKSSSVFNQLQRFRLERNFGRRSAPLLEADGDPLLEAPKEWICVQVRSLQVRSHFSGTVDPPTLLLGVICKYIGASH